MSRVGVVACGALAVHVRAIARRRGWSVDVHPLPALLHNRPSAIPAAVEESLASLSASYEVLAVAYADCGTYGALDEALERAGVARLAGEHCYDVFGGPVAQRALEEEPGTYLLTDFLARTFEHTVVRELGLDRHPDLRDTYFGAYRRVVWLAQRPTAATRAAAERAAARISLPLEVREVGEDGLERGLEALLSAPPPELAGRL
jgi:hypothetical protein